MAAVIFGTYGIIALILIWFWTLPSDFRSALPFTFATLALLLFLAFVAFKSHTKTLRGDKVLLWLRRFRRDRRRTTNFADVLRSAAAGVATPVTIQDSTFSGSGEVIAGRIPQSTGTLFVFRLILLVVGMVAAVLSIALPRETGLVLAAAAIVALAAALAWWLRRSRYFRVSHDRIESDVADVLDRATQLHWKEINWWRFALSFFVGPMIATWLTDDEEPHQKETLLKGIIVFQCDDDHWQRVVELCLQSAAAVVVDLADLSTHVRWEIERAIQLVGAESVIFVAPADAEGRASDDAELLLRELNGDGRIRVFRYPEELRGSLFERRRQRREIIAKFEDEIDAAVAAWIVRIRAIEKQSPVDRYVAQYRVRKRLA